MSEVTHTQGPWHSKHVHSEPNQSMIILKDGVGGWVMAVKHNGEFMEARQHANARLIAAAPDMYDVTKGVEELRKLFCNSDVDADEVKAAVELLATQARAAIAKAQQGAPS